MPASRVTCMQCLIWSDCRHTGHVGSTSSDGFTVVLGHRVAGGSAGTRTSLRLPATSTAWSSTCEGGGGGCLSRDFSS